MTTSVGGMLRIFRQQRDVTLKDIATSIGVTKQYLSALETGTARGSPALLRRLADRLGIDPDMMRHWYVMDAKHDAEERWDAARPGGDGKTNG